VCVCVYVWCRLLQGSLLACFHMLLPTLPGGGGGGGGGRGRGGGGGGGGGGGEGQEALCPLVLNAHRIDKGLRLKICLLLYQRQVDSREQRATVRPAQIRT